MAANPKKQRGESSKSKRLRRAGGLPDPPLSPAQRFVVFLACVLVFLGFLIAQQDGQGPTDVVVFLWSAAVALAALAVIWGPAAEALEYFELAQRLGPALVPVFATFNALLSPLTATLQGVAAVFSRTRDAGRWAARAVAAARQEAGKAAETARRQAEREQERELQRQLAAERAAAKKGASGRSLPSAARAASRPFKAAAPVTAAAPAAAGAAAQQGPGSAAADLEDDEAGVSSPSELLEALSRPGKWGRPSPAALAKAVAAAEQQEQWHRHRVQVAIEEDESEDESSGEGAPGRGEGLDPALAAGYQQLLEQWGPGGVGSPPPPERQASGEWEQWPEEEEEAPPKRASSGEWEQWPEAEAAAAEADLPPPAAAVAEPPLAQQQQQQPAAQQQQPPAAQQQQQQRSPEHASAGQFAAGEPSEPPTLLPLPRLRSPPQPSPAVPAEQAAAGVPPPLPAPLPPPRPLPAPRPVRPGQHAQAAAVQGKEEHLEALLAAVLAKPPGAAEGGAPPAVGTAPPAAAATQAVSAATAAGGVESGASSSGSEAGAAGAGRPGGPAGHEVSSSNGGPSMGWGPPAAMAAELLPSERPRRPARKPPREQQQQQQQGAAAQGEPPGGDERLRRQPRQQPPAENGAAVAPAAVAAAAEAAPGRRGVRPADGRGSTAPDAQQGGAGGEPGSRGEQGPRRAPRSRLSGQGGEQSDGQGRPPSQPRGRPQQEGRRREAGKTQGRGRRSAASSPADQHPHLLGERAGSWGLLPGTSPERAAAPPAAAAATAAAVRLSNGSAAAASPERTATPGDAGPQTPERMSFAAALRAQGLGLELQAEEAAADAKRLSVGGLSNEAGEYNCFLNAIIQCLWHCEEFRQQVAAWPEFLCNYNPVLRALHGLFAELDAEERQRAGARGGGGSSGSSAPGTEAPSVHSAPSGQSVVNPNRLREALGALAGQRFRAGEMNDSAELLLTLFDQVNAGATAAKQFGLPQGEADLGAVFGLPVHEFVYCSRCGLSTHDYRYAQYYYNTQATSLREVQRVHAGRGLGQLLRIVDERTLKSCDTDKGGCGARLPVVHALERAPHVFTLQLAWQSQREEAADIAATLSAVGETMDLKALYRGLPPGPHLYRLRSLVCYYGEHYFAFVLLRCQQAWYMFDDTRVSRVGSWADVQRKCAAGRSQPSLLLWEAEG